MPEKQTTIKISIDSVFLLDESKLIRLVNVIIDKYNNIDINPILSFEMHLLNGKHITVNELEHIFTQDNSITNPIDINSVRLTDQKRPENSWESVRMG